MIKKSIVIKANRIKPIKFDCKIAIFFTLLVCGVIIGITCANKFCQSDNNIVTPILESYISSCSKLSFFKNFCNAFLIAFFVIFAVFILGFCAVGVPIIWLIPFLFGIFCGGVVTCLFCQNGISGLLFSILINIPCYAITAATLIKCCCESSKLSIDLFGVILGEGAACNKNKGLLKDYLIFFLVMCIPIIIASLLKTICFTLFSGFFNFV